MSLTVNGDGNGATPSTVISTATQLLGSHPAAVNNNPTHLGMLAGLQQRKALTAGDKERAAQLGELKANLAGM